MIVRVFSRKTLAADSDICLTSGSESIQSFRLYLDNCPGEIIILAPTGRVTLMSLNLRIVLNSCAFCALLGSSAANGETVLKLSLGNTGPDLAMDASGVLGTTSDGNAGTIGDQDTAIDYTGFLDPLFADVTTSSASFS